MFLKVSAPIKKQAKGMNRQFEGENIWLINITIIVIRVNNQPHEQSEIKTIFFLPSRMSKIKHFIILSVCEDGMKWAHLYATGTN